MDLADSNEYDVRPLVAYDKKGTLIEPEQYEPKLTGALVEVYFKPRYWLFMQDKKPFKNIFSADIVSLQVLAEPNADNSMPASPSKRPQVFLTNPHLSPSKKPRNI